MGRITQINVSDGGVPKRPVPEARVEHLGLEGDRQAELGIHGGRARAVSLFSADRIAALRAEGHPIEAGLAGENVTVEGLDWERIAPGARLRLGDDVRLEITDYARPCVKNAGWFLDGDFARISQARNPGWSRLVARVLEPGTIRTGDAAELVESGRRGMSIPEETAESDGSPGPLDALDVQELLDVARGDAEVRGTLAYLWDVVSPLLLFAGGAWLLWASTSGSASERIGVALGVFLIAYGVSSWVENEAVEHRIDALVELLERRQALDDDSPDDPPDVSSPA